MKRRTEVQTMDRKTEVQTRMRKTERKRKTEVQTRRRKSEVQRSSATWEDGERESKKRREHKTDGVTFLPRGWPGTNCPLIPSSKVETFFFKRIVAVGAFWALTTLKFVKNPRLINSKNVWFAKISIWNQICRFIDQKMFFYKMLYGPVQQHNGSFIFVLLSNMPPLKKLLPPPLGW